MVGWTVCVVGQVGEGESLVGVLSGGVIGILWMIERSAWRGIVGGPSTSVTKETSVSGFSARGRAVSKADASTAP